MDVQKKTHDQQAKEFWDFARHVSEEVEEWPAWKRDALVTLSEQGQRVAKKGVSNTVKVVHKARTGQFVSRKEPGQKKNTSVVETGKKKK
jgi:hypothetical protein